ncbi:hypothetical protein A5806_002530, partial [Enterococcus faecium]
LCSRFFIKIYIKYNIYYLI